MQYVQCAAVTGPPQWWLPCCDTQPLLLLLPPAWPTRQLEPPLLERRPLGRLPQSTACCQLALLAALLHLLLPSPELDSLLLQAGSSPCQNAPQPQLSASASPA